MSDRSSSRLLRARLILALIAPVVLFGIAEVAVRMSGLASPSGLVAVRPGEQAGTVSIHALGIQADTPRATPAFKAAKKPGAYRIVLFGESAAAGFPYMIKNSTPARWLQLRVDLMLPQRPIEIIDATISGINSDWIVEVARAMLAYEPDLFIVYAGNNEFLDPYVERRANENRVLLREFIRRSALVRLLHDVTKGSQIDAPFGPTTYPAGIDDRPLGETRKRVIDGFAHNMETIAQFAQTAGVKVMFVRPAVALRGWSPRASVFTRAVDDATKDRMRGLVRNGTIEMRKDHFDAAKELLAQAAAVDPDVALLVFREAELAEKQGDAKSAYSLYHRALDLDDRPNRVAGALASRLQEVATRMGCIWFDSHATFERYSKDSIVGSDLVIDHCHLTVEGQYRLSTELVLELSRLGIPAPLSDWQFDKDLNYTVCFERLGIDVAAALEPENQVAYAAIVAAMDENNPEQRLEHLWRAHDRFDHVLDRNPKQAQALIGRGLVRAAEGAVEAAVVDFDNAYKIEPAAVLVFEANVERFAAFKTIMKNAGLTIRDGRVLRVVD